jgi:hypothetical protein
METTPPVRTGKQQLSLWQSVVSQNLLDTVGADKKAATPIQTHPLMQVVNEHVALPAAGKNDFFNVSQCIYEALLKDVSQLTGLSEPERTKFIGEVIQKCLGALPEDSDFRKYSDADWLNFLCKCVSDYVEYYIKYDGKLKYNSWKDSGDIKLGVMDFKIPNDAKVAVIGDWGTGMQDAVCMLDVILAEHHPDVIIHLGDIYYSATESECRDNFSAVFAAAFKKYGKAIPVFTIPGNHDYYCFGYDYYEMVEKLNPDFPGAQQTTSYFCLRTEDNGWQFLGMDTSYEDSNPVDQMDPFYAAPSIQDSEKEWHLDKLENFSGATILLSHHQLFSAAAKLNGVCSDYYSYPYLNKRLYDIFSPYFGNKIACWYWGHEHNQILFNDHLYGLAKGRLTGASAYEEALNEDPYKTNPCAPFNESVKLNNSDGYYDHGYVILDFSGRAQPTDSIAATYYNYLSWGAAAPDPIPNTATALFSEKLSLPSPQEVSKLDNSCRQQFLTGILNEFLDNKIAADLIGDLGFAYDSKQGLFYSRTDAWQHNLGYFTLYDYAAPFTMMFIDCEPIRFNYAGKEWNIEFWKGQYGICTGAEVGIYTGKFKTGISRIDNILSLLEAGDTACAPKEDWLQMSFVLKRKGEEFFTRNSDNPATPEIEKQWWLTGFKPGFISAPSDLVNEITIVFKDEAMQQAFTGGLVKVGYQPSEYTVLNPTTVQVIFSKPHTAQPLDWEIKIAKEVLGDIKEILDYLKKIFPALAENFSIGDIVSFLDNAYGHLAPSQLVTFLKELGFPLDQIGKYLKDTFQLGFKDLAVLLAKAGFDMDDIVAFIKKAFDLSWKDLADLLSLIKKLVKSSIK